MVLQLGAVGRRSPCHAGGLPLRHQRLTLCPAQPARDTRCQRGHLYFDTSLNCHPASMGLFRPPPSSFVRINFVLSFDFASGEESAERGNYNLSVLLTVGL